MGLIQMKERNKMGTGAGWYYDSHDGDVVHQNFFESIPNVGFGDYYIGPFNTAQEAMQAGQAYAAQHGTPNPMENENANQQVAGIASDVTGSLIPSLFTQRGFAERVVLVLLGGALIVVGIREFIK
jgi:hypothetical protein